MIQLTAQGVQTYITVSRVAVFMYRYYHERLWLVLAEETGSWLR